MFIESGIRGDISYIANRYARETNPLLDTYDPSEQTSYLLYFDMNNLYDHALVQRMPTSSFRFLRQREIDQFAVRSEPENDDKGYSGV